MGKGSRHITANGELSTSGMPVVLYSVSINSNGSAGLVILRNGTSAGADVLLSLTGVANEGISVPLNEDGLMFPNGCYMDIDGNVESVTISFERI